MWENLAESCNFKTESAKIFCKLFFFNGAGHMLEAVEEVSQTTDPETVRRSLDLYSIEFANYLNEKYLVKVMSQN